MVFEHKHRFNIIVISVFIILFKSSKVRYDLIALDSFSLFIFFLLCPRSFSFQIIFFEDKRQTEKKGKTKREMPVLPFNPCLRKGEVKNEEKGNEKGKGKG